MWIRADDSSRRVGNYDNRKADRYPSPACSGQGQTWEDLRRESPRRERQSPTEKKADSAESFPQPKMRSPRSTVEPVPAHYGKIAEPSKSDFRQHLIFMEEFPNSLTYVSDSKSGKMSSARGGKYSKGKSFKKQVPGGRQRKEAGVCQGSKIGRSI